MADLKVSTWLIVLVIFSAAIVTSVGFIQSINSQYPDANISSEWETSFDKMDTLNQSTTSIRDSVTSGESSKITTVGLANAIWDGTTTAILNGFKTLALLDDMIFDFIVYSGLPIPIWVITVIVSIIVISLIFTVLSAWLKKGI
jgi:hypothetical protein